MKKQTLEVSRSKSRWCSLCGDSFEKYLATFTQEEQEDATLVEELKENYKGMDTIEFSHRGSYGTTEICPSCVESMITGYEMLKKTKAIESVTINTK